jgi:hypothetical protein
LAFGQIIQDNPDIFKIKKKLKNKWMIIYRNIRTW